ncbi:hypothetical protein Tco_1241904, partial [Tanacetum coccineum]
MKHLSLKFGERVEGHQTDLRECCAQIGKEVKSLEKALKRKSKKVIVSTSKGEEPEDHGR